MADSDDLMFFSHAPERLTSFGLQIEMADRLNGLRVLTAPRRHDLRVVVEMYRGADNPVIEVEGHADEQGKMRLDVRRVRSQNSTDRVVRITMGDPLR